MGLFSKKGLGQEIRETADIEKAPKAKKEPKAKPTKPTLKVKNDPSKGASFWVVEVKAGVETMLFSGTISECRDYLYLASKGLIM